MKTRAEIQAMPIVGNAHSDRGIMDALHALIMDETASMEDRLWALDHLSMEVMGLDEQPATHVDLQDYMDSCS